MRISGQSRDLQPTNNQKTHEKANDASIQEGEDGISETNTSDFDDEDNDNFESFFTLPKIDQPISREGMSLRDWHTITAAEFEQAKAVNSEEHLIRKLIDGIRNHSDKEIEIFGKLLNAMAQLCKRVQSRIRIQTPPYLIKSNFKVLPFGNILIAGIEYLMEKLQSVKKINFLNEENGLMIAGSLFNVLLMFHKYSIVFCYIKIQFVSAYKEFVIKVDCFMVYGSQVLRFDSFLLSPILNLFHQNQSYLLTNLITIVVDFIYSCFLREMLNFAKRRVILNGGSKWKTNRATRHYSLVQSTNFHTTEHFNQVGERAPIYHRNRMPKTLFEVLESLLKSATPAIKDPRNTAGVSNSAAIPVSASWLVSTTPASTTSSMDNASLLSKLSSPAISFGPSASVPTATASDIAVVSLLSSPPVPHVFEQVSESGAPKAPATLSTRPPPLLPHDTSARLEDATATAEVPKPSIDGQEVVAANRSIDLCKPVASIGLLGNRVSFDRAFVVERSPIFLKLDATKITHVATASAASVTSRGIVIAVCCARHDGVRGERCMESASIASQRSSLSTTKRRAPPDHELAHVRKQSDGSALGIATAEYWNVCWRTTEKVRACASTWKTRDAGNRLSCDATSERDVQTQAGGRATSEDTLHTLLQAARHSTSGYRVLVFDLVASASRNTRSQQATSSRVRSPSRILLRRVRRNRSLATAESFADAALVSAEVAVENK